MRIIAGEFRGRRLLGPEDESTRPITDRAKQSLFDILSPMIEGAVVYDCFAGTGSMGLECLSRGAERVFFFESGRSAAERLRRNIETLGLKGRSQVIAGDLFEWFARAPDPEARASLLFLDPPYRFVREQAAPLQRLAAIVADRHLLSDGTVIFRHDVADSLELPGLHRYDERRYGSMAIELLRQATGSNPPAANDDV